MKIWNMADKSDMTAMTIQAHDKSINTACFLDNKGQVFATGGDDCKIIVWSVSVKGGKIVRYIAEE